MVPSNFDPNNYAPKNGNFIGLPYTEAEAAVVFLPVPWEATVSSTAGTAGGPTNILEASYQLDLWDDTIPEAWTTPIYFVPVSPQVAIWNAAARPLAAAHIDRLEAQKPIDPTLVEQVNTYSTQVNTWVYEQSRHYLAQGKIVGLLGGEHSVPLGYLKALAEQGDFGILQIDAHADLRVTYEDFTYSHASIFHNALQQIPQIAQLTQVGLRDIAPSEHAYAQQLPQRVQQFLMADLRRAQLKGTMTYHDWCTQILATLPQQVYISFDVDGLAPSLCPHTGTPVPGGLSYWEAIYLLEQVVISGRQLIGFDLCEVAGEGDLDGNIGARLAYKMALLSQYSSI